MINNLLKKHIHWMFELFKSSCWVIHRLLHYCWENIFRRVRKFVTYPTVLPQKNHKAWITCISFIYIAEISIYILWIVFLRLLCKKENEKIPRFFDSQKFLLYIWHPCTTLKTYCYSYPYITALTIVSILYTT